MIHSFSTAGYDCVRPALCKPSSQKKFSSRDSSLQKKKL